MNCLCRKILNAICNLHFSQVCQRCAFQEEVTSGKTKRNHSKKSYILSVMRRGICPKCNSPMVQRLNSKTKQYFWGCNRYPHCTETKTYVDNTPDMRAANYLDRVMKQPQVERKCLVSVDESGNDQTLHWLTLCALCIPLEEAP